MCGLSKITYLGRSGKKERGNNHCRERKTDFEKDLYVLSSPFFWASCYWLIVIPYSLIPDLFYLLPPSPKRLPSFTSLTAPERQSRSKALGSNTVHSDTFSLMPYKPSSPGCNSPVFTPPSCALAMYPYAGRYLSMKGNTVALPGVLRQSRIRSMTTLNIPIRMTPEFSSRRFASAARSFEKVPLASVFAKTV